MLIAYGAYLLSLIFIDGSLMHYPVGIMTLYAGIEVTRWKIERVRLIGCGREPIRYRLFRRIRELPLHWRVPVSAAFISFALAALTFALLALISVDQQ